MEDCVRILELVDNVISCLGHNDQLTCLRVNSTWYRLSIPHVFQWSFHILQEGGYTASVFRLRDCDGAQVALKRNLRLAQGFEACNPVAVDIIHGSNNLVNLTKFAYRGHNVISGESMWELAPILQSLPVLTHLEFESWSYFDVPSLKFLSHSLPKKTLKSLKMTVHITDSHLDVKVKEVFGDKDSIRTQDVLWVQLGSLKLLTSPQSERIVGITTLEHSTAH
ncbi:hypothetical protein BGZ81_009381 [Podila clonocystis]|nr:hypothetical protein BGZ81_009381 [Podila clonocystis]